MKGFRDITSTRRPDAILSKNRTEIGRRAFLGDEINVHLPQSELARAECQEIAATREQRAAGAVPRRAPGAPFDARR